MAIVLGTDSDDVLRALRQIDSRMRNEVAEITLDLSDSMNRICRYAFPRAKRVIDRFHVQKQALESVQEVRIVHRWDAINADGKPDWPARNTNRSASPMATPSRSCLPVDDMPCSSPLRNGPHPNVSGLT
ncbi:transposase [uncultured Duncaniella sp.]|uniref:transposase n=1 Tax=uncultured Duncaniella sp. TaxID=2768039 RepID=UPI00262CB997|nr:transposase [uncultured Duncaniella sp.]